VLSVYQGNRAEALADRLADLLAEPVLAPLEAETVVVPGQGVARWLTARLAERLGVCANVRFPLPASFVWGCFRTLLEGLPERSAWEPGPLIWRVWEALQAARAEPAFGAVGAYLAGGDELKGFRLAERVAEVLDRYLVYRPDWVRDWERGGGEDWQALLWRRLRASGAGPHWVAVRDRFVAALEAPGAGRDRLPPRVTLFTPGALSPGYLDLIARLGEAIDVHLFLLNPSREYWGDVESPAATARRRSRWRREGRSDASRYFATGNPLLASWGRAGRDFLDGLQAWSLLEEDLYEPPDERRLLGAVQGDLLELRDRGRSCPPAPLPGDESIQVHACHGPLREVQVLHDRLLDLFQRLPGLEPRQVLVLAPDMDLYAPYVAAVFGAAPADRYIPWAVAGHDAGDGEELTAAFLQLLDLPASRLPASEVLGLLDLPAVQRRFGLAQADLPTVRAWVREAGVRWGASRLAREGVGLPAFEEGSWALGLRRLFLGYAMPPVETLFQGVVPYPHVEGAAAAALGGLQSLVDALVRWQEGLAGAYAARAWAERCGALIDDFFVPDEAEAVPMQALRDAAAALADEAEGAGYSGAFGREVMRARLEALLPAGRGAPPLLAGAVTFAGLGSLPGVPARVVCLLGMNGADFPRLRRPPGFDRMAREPRPGDRSRRDEDRYLFLEALLAARDVLYVSFVGRSARDDSPRVPAVVVSELLDYLDQGFTVPEGKPRDRVLTVHPLQPFSRRYFDGRDPRLFTYAREWTPGGAAAGPFLAGALPAPGDGPVEVELDGLVRFLRNPAACFLRERLGVRLAEGGDVPEDKEPFALDPLAAYGLKQEALAAALAGGATDARLPFARARGDLPPGRVGELAYREAVASVGALADAVRAEASGAAGTLEVDLEVATVPGPCRLRGWLTGVGPQGLLTFRPGRVKAADRLRLWVHHLALCAVAPDGVAPASAHLGEDGAVRYGAVPDARLCLGRLVEAYRDNLVSPLPFFPETSYAYASALAAGKGREEALKAAWRPWWDDYNDRGESLDPSVRVVFRGVEPLDTRFESLASELLGPLIAAGPVGRG
jgi:exodeoxyribonuclease V gamma subunit